jgi:hypothetical protein
MNPAEELAVIGNIKDTITVLGRKFVMQTLDSDAEVLSSAAATSFNEETRDRVLRVEKLARAISTIDGVPFSVSEEEKAQGLSEIQKARRLLYKWQPTVINRVYEELLKLEKRREQAVSELEKNAQTPITSTGAGK